MILYYSNLSTYSQKTLLGFFEKDVPVDLIAVDLADDHACEQYRAIYPIGKVPLLLRDDGQLIPESTIILEYLDLNFGEPHQLIPTEPELARKVRLMDRMCDLYLNDPVVAMITESWKSDHLLDQRVLELGSQKVAYLYRLLDAQLSHTQYVAGEAFSLADCAAMPALAYARGFAPFHGFAALERYWQAMSQRPAWVSVTDLIQSPQAEQTSVEA